METTTFKAQKGSDDIIKITHVTSVIQPQFYEPTRKIIMCKENINNDFIQQFLQTLIRIHNSTMMHVCELSL